MIYIDFETYSEVDIKKAGSMAYAKHDSTQILCLGHAVDDDQTEVWSVGKGPLPIRDRVAAGEPILAFNATFDVRIWNYVGVPNFGWPRIKLSQVIDVQALCGCYQVPQNLDAAGEALRIIKQKDAAGKALIRKCCQPNKKGEQPFPNTPEMRMAFRDLFRYCARDVDAMREIVSRLPRHALIPQEQELWQLTVEMNSAGLPIDYKAVKYIHTYLQQYITEAQKQLPLLTDGFVCTPGQTAKMKEFCKAQGYPIPNVQAETVEDILAKKDVPDKVRKVLELRQELGRSSTAKYTKILDQAHCLNGDKQYWVYDNLRYHGAGTGRWTGQGFQMHNLPRASVEDPEAVIHKFLSGQTVEDPVYAAKALIRPMITAPPGYKLIVIDYSSIENRLLAWTADDFDTLRDFKEGYDQYKVMAAARFGKHYDDVEPEERRVGKVIILGCGYGMGGKKFKETAKTQAGLILSLEEAVASVNAYRERYPKVKALWAHARNAAASAVLSGKRQQYKNMLFGTFKAKGTLWLALQLPTGKCIYYMEPSIKEMLIPDYEYMGTVPTITHWGINPYTKKWSRLKLIPGRIVENMVQGTAREVMGRGMLNVKKHMPHLILIGSVHDEALALVKDEDATEETLQEYNHHLCNVDFLPGCPIVADGYIAQRYKKA